MISQKHKFIFVHVPKCGGTSMERVFLDLDDSCVKTIHSNVNWYKENYSSEWANYFKFTFVRNPWYIVCSYYFFLRDKPNSHKPKVRKYARNLPFSDWVKRTVRRVRKQRIIPPSGHRLLTRQCDFANDTSEINFIGRFENIQEDFNIVCGKIGIPHQKLPHKNKSKHKHYTEYYDDETRQIVAEKYAKDIEMFGYEFGE